VTELNPEVNIILGLSNCTFDKISEFVDNYYMFGFSQKFTMDLNSMLTNIYNRFELREDLMKIQLSKNKPVRIDDELSVNLRDDGSLEIIEDSQ